MRSTRAFVIGIGTAYFFDPRRGKRRRNIARDRGAKTVRQMSRLVGKKARFSAGKARGAYARRPFAVSPPESERADAIVEQRIRSDAFRDVDVSPGDLEIGVEDGLVTVTGEVVGDKRASDIVARIGKVPGVENVAAMIHVINEPNDRAA